MGSRSSVITTVAAATTPRKKRSSSLFSASFKRRWSTRKYTLKLMENSRANTAMIISITGLPYAPTLAFRFEKPPVPAVEKAWINASYRGIPASLRRTTSREVMAK